VSAAIALLTGLPAASADELADCGPIRNSSRSGSIAFAGAASGTRPCRVRAGDAAGGGAGHGWQLPRSFLIPGTDTSLRIGGIAWTDVVWYLKGARNTTALNNQGGNPDGSQNGLGGTGRCPLFRSTTRSGIRAAAR
jgi:hypothetical protein